MENSDVVFEYLKEDALAKIFKYIAYIFICVSVIMASIVSFNMPHIYMEWETKECLFILENTKGGQKQIPCHSGEIPDSYQTIWVTDKNRHIKKKLIESKGFKLEKI